MSEYNYRYQYKYSNLDPMNRGRNTGRSQTGSGTQNTGYISDNLARAYREAPQNTARKTAAAPARELSVPEVRRTRSIRPELLTEDERRQEAERKARVQYKRERAAARNLDVFSMLFLMCAVMLTSFTVLHYVGLQADITQLSRQAASLETEVIEMKNSNKSAKAAATAAVSLADIYDTATKKLGMVAAKKDQIIYYQTTAAASVRQYEQVPQVEKAGIADSLMAKLRAWWKNG